MKKIAITLTRLELDALRTAFGNSYESGDEAEALFNGDRKLIAASVRVDKKLDTANYMFISADRVRDAHKH